MADKILKQVTVTGADNSVDPRELFDIATKYPFVEWGILLSKNASGLYRFPTLDWIKELIDNYPTLNLSGHLCGEWVRDVCGGGSMFYNERVELIRGFKRFQLNFHSYQHLIRDNNKFFKALEVISPNGQQIIFQLDNVNNHIYYELAKNSGLDVAPFYDLSGGAGVLPLSWIPMSGYCGYAGGLSPENLHEQLGLIAQVGGKVIWIDAETHLRSSGDSLFDLDKVVAFLEVAKDWVINSEEMEATLVYKQVVTDKVRVFIRNFTEDGCWYEAGEVILSDCGNTRCIDCLVNKIHSLYMNGEGK